MKIKLHEITARELVAGYEADGEGGVANEQEQDLLEVTAQLR